MAKMSDPVTLTAAALALCATLGVSPCSEGELMGQWFYIGGMCANFGCNFVEACPNDSDLPCRPITDPAYECIHIANYPTIGSLANFKKDDTLDGAGGKEYACRPKEAPTS
jgi:hypothetical protein